MIYQGKARYPVTEIILHCADTRPDWMAGRPISEKVAEIRRWHVQERGWRDIGYHWVIDRDGSVAPGRRETEIGAHVEGHNRGTIGICLLGGYGAKADDPFEKSFTAAQRAEVKRLIGEITGRTAIRKVSGHNEYALRACPGFRVNIHAHVCSGSDPSHAHGSCPVSADSCLNDQRRCDAAALLHLRDPEIGEVGPRPRIA